MIIVDIESSGVDPHKHSILSIGAVEFEHPENQFYEECRVWDGAHIDKDALAVNGFSEVEARDPKKKSDNETVQAFLKWALKCNDRTLAGQNPSFDRDFLQVTAARYHIDWPFAQRTIDVHSVAYFHAIKHGFVPPTKNNHSNFSLDEILGYCGVPGEPKPHNGLMGAKLEGEVLSRLFNERPLFKEWEHYVIPWLK